MIFLNGHLASLIALVYTEVFNFRSSNHPHITALWQNHYTLCSAQGLTLRTSASQSCYGNKFTVIKHLITSCLKYYAKIFYPITCSNYSNVWCYVKTYLVYYLSTRSWWTKETLLFCIETYPVLYVRVGNCDIFCLRQFSFLFVAQYCLLTQQMKRKTYWQELSQWL